MCGIAGIFAYHYASPDIDEQELLTIRDHMIRRGPDGSGIWVSEDRRVAFGHRRLSIIDLSDAGAQPMKNEDGSIVVTFNGEIYNYRELREALIRKGYRFRSNCDTEVLIHLYAEKGEQMVHDLRGMFAFALWDAKKKALWLVRDPYGIKPLYYANDGWTVRFASQVKALLTSKKVSKDLEPAGQVGFFLFGSVPEPFTLYQEIRSIPAGASIWFDQLGEEAPQKHFSIAEIYEDAARAENELSLEQAQIQIKEAVKESVQYHFVSDVPVALFLSSGIDSSLIAVLSHELGTHNLCGITLGFKEFEGTSDDEVPLAAEIASKLGIKHFVYQVSKKEFEEDLPDILKAMDQPSIDGINTYFVSKAARKAGFKVAISGVGGDELFGGYDSFRQIPKLVHGLSFLAHVPLAGDSFRLALTALRSMGVRIHPKWTGVLKFSKNYPQAYFLKRGLFMPWELPEVIADKEIIRRGLERLNLEKYLTGSLTPDPKKSFSRVAALESNLYLRNQLLRDADWAGMAHSLEIRTPLVDNALLKKTSFATSSFNNFQNKKALLAPVVRKISTDLLDRSKTGFVIPMQDWLAPGVGRLNFPRVGAREIWSRFSAYV